MKCLVTGGAGFIGSHVQDKLIAAGHEVAVIDNFSSGKRENLNSKAQLYELDIRDPDKVLSAFKDFQPQAVFHLAAQVEVPYSMTHPLEDTQINILGMINILESARQFKLKKFVYSNTGGAYYGDVPETDLPITEDHLVKLPASFYGVSKAAAEQYLKLYGHIYSLPWVSLRYANVYGPRQAGNKEAGIVAIFTAKMLAGEVPTINGDGLHTRDYVYVGDVVAANLAALNYQDSDYFNIATGIATSNNQVFATLEGYLKTGRPANHGPDRPGDTRHSTLSPQKALTLLHWSPQVSFARGVRLTLESYGRHVT